MFQNDQVFTGEIGLVVLTVVPIFAAALVGLAISMRRLPIAVSTSPVESDRYPADKHACSIFVRKTMKHLRPTPQGFLKSHC